MEFAVEKLEVLVMQAKVTLDSMVFELEEEISQDAGRQMKPSDLIRAVHEMQEELAKLEKESNSLLEKHDDIRQQLGKSLEVACKELQNLQSTVGSGLTGYKTIHTDTSGSALKKHFDKMKV